MTRQQPGWESEPVMLTRTADIAAAAFEIVADLEAQLRDLLPTCQIEHIGATSFPDGVTKGDVDVNIRVSPGDFQRVIDRLRSTLPIAQPDNWTSTYASFSDASRALPVGVQVTVIGSPDDFLVPLRDLMTRDAELRSEYDRVKRNAAELGPDGYWTAKNAFLTKVLARHLPNARPVL
jgi:GrpB-like predicted nucleotidyltransferase (UPF0157 family)